MGKIKNKGRAKINYIEKYVPKKYRDAIVDIDKDMDGWWAYLTDDYISTTTECHTIHELTLAEFKKEFKTIVKVSENNS